MSATSRIVRRLRLRGPTESAIRRAIPLVEDAIRTATLPGDGGRMVLVRRMAIGRIEPRTTSQSVAVDVGHAWERVAPACTHGTGGDLAAAPAVWFRDALEAHATLALRLLGGATADAWYWRLAVRAWRPSLPVADAVRRIMLSLASLQEARSALPQWTSALAHAGHAERLVSALRVEDVALLARAAGLRVSAPGEDLSEAADRYAAATLYAADDAGRDAARMSRATLTSSRHGAGSAARDPRRELVRTLLRAGGSSAFEAATWLSSGRKAGQPDAKRCASGPGVSTGDLGATGHDPLESHAQEVGRAAGSDARRGIDDGSGAAATSSSTETANAASAPGPSDAFDSIAASTRIPAAMNGRAPEREPDSALHRRRTGADRDIGAEQLLAAPSAETCAGGLLFLVPVLDRLGYAAWLEAQPQWARLDVARRVFELVLARLGVDGSDAAWQLVGNAADPTWQPGRLADASMKPYALARQPDGRIAPRRRFESRQKRSVRVPRRFVAPAGWRTELRTQGESLQLVEHPAIATLWDPSGRLLLGAWRGPCPRELLSARRRANSSGPARENSRRHRLASAELEPERHDFARLVTSAWLVAARRWLRRHAGIGIATLVRRRALLVLTPTHLDLASELASADMRIRRAGLDIDPGWVPWLGRVVSFHYRETEPGIPT